MSQVMVLYLLIFATHLTLGLAAWRFHLDWSGLIEPLVMPL
jgi:hypothetical protein